ncbi:MAG: hypothetical protein QM655_07725 [Nocardioidaceae bacterium]
MGSPNCGSGSRPHRGAGDHAPAVPASATRQAPGQPGPGTGAEQGTSARNAPRVRAAGRTQQLAYDATAIQARSVDIDARIGWLLAVNRLYHPDPDFASGPWFVQALADQAGVTASRSLVSRWEAGELVVPYDAVEGYEIVLGLPAGCLTGAVPALRHSVDRPLPVPARATAPGWPGRLDAVLDTAIAGNAIPFDWQQLGWLARGAGGLFLREADWSGLAAALVCGVSRYRGHGALVIRAAVGDLASTVRADVFVADAVAARLLDSAAQVFSRPFQLLETFDSSYVGDVVLSVLEGPRTEMLNLQSVALTTRLVERGVLTDDQRSRVGMEVLRRWRSGVDVFATGLVELIAALPDSLSGALADAATDDGALAYALTHAETPADDCQGIAESMAARARSRLARQPRHGVDRMLPRLLREALFHRDFGRRQLALTLLRASPFRSPLVDELLDRLDADPPGSAGRFALRAVYELSSDEHRLRLLRLLPEADDATASLLLVSIGGLTQSPISDLELRGRLAPDPTLRSLSALYALGMSGSAAIARIAADPAAPGWQQTAARWWLDHGPVAPDT